MNSRHGRHIISVALALILLGSLSPVVAQSFYRWTDANGTTHFSSQPPPNQTDARAVELEPLNTISAQPINEREPRNVRAAAKPARPKIVMYGAQWCGYCKKARNWLAANNVKYTEYDTETSAKGKADYIKYKATGVPFFLVNGELWRGYSQGRFERLLQ